MKKKLFLPFVAALALSACSEDEPANGSSNVAGGDGQFLAINIVSTGGADSRADGLGDRYNGENNSQFEDGLTAENEVKNVRLYFFTATGTSINVKKGSNVNYYDVPVDQIGTDDPAENHGTTVERILKAVVMIDKGERLPAQVVAIINPQTEGTGNGFLGNTSLSLSALQEKYNDYAALANATTPTFVMANSVYKDANGIVVAVPVSAANYATSAEDAKKNPVEIYVERNVAKVRLKNGLPSTDKQSLTDGSTIYKVWKKGTDGAADTEYTLTDVNSGKGTQVYVKLDGWDVTADVNYGNLIKKIRDNWRDNLLGGSVVWTRPAYHRSYWADYCDPASEELTNRYFAYTEDGKFGKTKFDGNEAIYCNENAEKEPKSANQKDVENTSVIIKATLCDVNGKALPIVEYGGSRWIDNETLYTLKNRYITMMKASKTELPWREIGTATDGKKTFKQLSPEELSFIAVENINPIVFEKTTTKTSAPYEVEDGRYYVYPCLSETAKEYTWYASVKEDATAESGYTTEPESVEDINKALAALSHAKVWNTGKTYYYADIMHLGDNNAGVVRNHIYDLNLTKIYGIGTPVYDETLDIIPEKPQKDDTFIAARVNILSWRIVNNNVTLEWD